MKNCEGTLSSIIKPELQIRIPPNKPTTLNSHKILFCCKSAIKARPLKSRVFCYVLIHRGSTRYRHLDPTLRSQAMPQASKSTALCTLRINVSCTLTKSISSCNAYDSRRRHTWHGTGACTPNAKRTGTRKSPKTQKQKVRRAEYPSIFDNGLYITFLQ